MLNAVLAASHLLNIREKRVSFFLEHENLFCHLEDSVFLLVEAVLKVAPQKIHLIRCHRDPPQIRH